MRTELTEVLAGFHGVIPQEAFRECDFRAGDLGLLLSGVPELDLREWREAAVVRRAAGVPEPVAAELVERLFRVMEAWVQFSPLLVDT